MVYTLFGMKKLQNMGAYMDTSLENSVISSSSENSSNQGENEAVKIGLFKRIASKIKSKRANTTEEFIPTTEFDKWVCGTVARTASKHIKVKNFYPDKVNIEIRVHGSHDGVFSILIDKNNVDKRKRLIVRPFDYKDHDVYIEGDANIILNLLKKHTSLKDEIENNSLNVIVKNKDNAKLLQLIEGDFTTSEKYLFIKANQYLNLNLMLAAFSLGCVTCGIFTYIITTDKQSSSMLNILCFLAAFAILPLAVINRNAFENFKRILFNVGVTLALALFFLNVFMICYDKYNEGSTNIWLYLLMVIFLFDFSIILCYYVASTAFFLWTLVNKVCTRLFGFTKSEEGDGYELKVKSTFLLKVITVVTTIIALVTYISPILSPIIEMLKENS